MKRVLFYEVQGQKLQQKQNGDYDNIVKGTKNYLYVQFHFDKVWDGMNKVLETSNEHDFRNSRAVAIRNNTAMIPNEVTDQKEIYFRVFGNNALNQMICTNTMLIKQKGV